MKKILIADDHALFRDGLKQLVQLLQPDLEIHEAGDYPQLIASVERIAPDLVVMDINMPGLDGSNGVLKVCEMAGDVPVVVLTADEHPDLARMCQSAGAAAYLSKSCDVSTILNTMREVMAGKSVYVDTGGHVVAGEYALTAQQRRLLALLVDGKSNKEIANELNLSLGTVKQYVSALLKTIGVDNRTQAALKGKSILQYLV